MNWWPQMKEMSIKIGSENTSTSVVWKSIYMVSPRKNIICITLVCKFSATVCPQCWGWYPLRYGIVVAVYWAKLRHRTNGGLTRGGSPNACNQRAMAETHTLENLTLMGLWIRRNTCGGDHNSMIRSNTRANNGRVTAKASGNSSTPWWKSSPTKTPWSSIRC